MPRRTRRRRAPRGRPTRARPRARPGPARRRSSTTTAATRCAPPTFRAACGPACCACGPRVRRAGCGPKGAPSAAAAAGGRHALRARAGHEGWVVGGAVRDLLLSTRPKDFDILTTATPAQARGRPGRPARAWRAGARSRRCLCLRRGPQGASWGLRGRLRGGRVRRSRSCSGTSAASWAGASRSRTWSLATTCWRCPRSARTPTARSSRLTQPRCWAPRRAGAAGPRSRWVRCQAGSP